MTDRKIDLTALDPSLDQVRWERMVRSVAVRGAEAAARRRPGRLTLQLAAWARPALAFAAALALLVWVPSWLRRTPTAPATAAAAMSDHAARIAAWAASDEPASANALLLALGDDDGSR
jgi:hypothetical protein